MSDAAHTPDIILVVDDSPDTLGFLTEALEAAGAMVLVATGGAEAIAIVERVTPDVILTRSCPASTGSRLVGG
jgi:CheY-like chemotaxis protein